MSMDCICGHSKESHSPKHCDMFTCHCGGFETAPVEAAKELLGNSINRIENVLHALVLGTINAEIAKSLLPEIVKDLKAGFVGVTAENPWSGE